MATLACKHKMYICGGIIERDQVVKDRLFNTIAAFGPLVRQLSDRQNVEMLLTLGLV